MPMLFFFYFFATLSILSAVFAISVRNPVHAVLFFISTFISSAVLFILIGAEFIAMIVLIVYIGAVAVLFLFVVMMLDIDYIRYSYSFTKHLILSILLCILFFLTVSFIIYSSSPNMKNSAIDYSTNNIIAIGGLLYTNYMYAFHLSGILLLVAIIGAISLTLQSRKRGIKKQNVLKQLTRSSSVKMIKVGFKKGIEWK